MTIFCSTPANQRVAVRPRVLTRLTVRAAGQTRSLVTTKVAIEIADVSKTLLKVGQAGVLPGIVHCPAFG
jgi:hypothetical protein